MHRLVSPFILEKYAAGESSGQFEAAALFVDMSGFSAMTSTLMTHGQHGAEVLARVMRAIFDPLVEAVYAQGGFITVFAGDAFTAVFPFADDRGGVTSPLHALAAAWAIRTHMLAHSQHATEYGVFSISAKVGLAVGDVEWGIIRSENDARSAFYFRGPAIDACAEAEHLAQSGDLILHTSALGEPGDAIETEEMGDGRRVTGIMTTLPEPQPVSLAPFSLDQLTYFFPSPVIEQSFSGEFREVINVFINLRGHPSGEQLAKIIQDVFDLQQKYGGFLNRIDFGDKGCNILLFWGAPIAHENDASRALNFLLGLHDRTSIPVRAGVTSRIAHAGFIGSILHEEYTCYGNGVNLAARLMTSAPWEGIWMDEPMRNLVAQVFDLAYEGEYAFKGFAEGQKVYSLLDHKTGVHRVTFAGKMVGRARELERLQRFVAPVLTTPGTRHFARVLVVSGEAGIGKSRLIEEFRQSNEDNDLQWLICQADPILRQPLDAFRYWLIRYFDYNPSQSDAHNKRIFSRKLEQLLKIASPGLNETLDQGRSFLAAMIGLHWDDSPYARLDPESRYERTMIALKALILAEAERKPAILLLEDAHWLDEDSLEFMQRLTRNIENVPLAILATARPDVQGRYLGPAVDYDELIIGGLDPAALTDLAANILESAPALPLLDLLAERSGGNPFFAEQVLLYLRDEHLLRQVNGVWAPEEQALKAAPLPSSLRSIFIARIDRLTREVKELVQTAAILGREFEIQVLSRMLNAPTLETGLKASEEAAIWTALSELRYLFKHTLLRDAAYDMQVSTRRGQMHLLAAQALETLYAEDLPDHLSEIAYHLEAAHRHGTVGVRERAREYLTEAARAAVRRYENTAASDYFTRALALTPDEDLATRSALLLEKERVLDACAEREAQFQCLKQLEALAEMLNDDHLRARVANRFANYGDATSDYAAGIVAAEKAAELARLANDAEQEALAHYHHGVIRYRQTNYHEALTDLVRAVNIANEASLANLAANALAMMAFINEEQGNLDNALSVAQEALDMYRQTGDRRGEADALNAIAIALAGQGDYMKARHYIEQALVVTHELGQRLNEARMLINLGNIEIGLEQFLPARSHIEQALQLALEIGASEGEGIALINLGVIDTKLGRLNEARQTLREAAGYQKMAGRLQGQAAALAYWSLAEYHAGEFETAKQLSAKAIELAEETGARPFEALALTCLGLSLTTIDPSHEAERALQSAIAIREEMGHVSLAMESRAGLAQALLAQGKLDAAHEQVVVIEKYLASEEASRTLPHGLDGAEDPLMVYLICYRVLSAADDPAAKYYLTHANDLLMAEADRLTDPEMRRLFLENVPYRREIQAAVETPDGSTPPPDEQSPTHLAPAHPPTATPGPRVDLTGSVLVRARLAGALLEGVSLRGADLTQADLRGASLVGADLRGALLIGADLRGTDLTVADLRGANLADITFDASTRWPEGFTP